MALRILLGIMVLGFAFQMSGNIYRDMKRTESGTERRYLYGMKVELWKEPLPPGKRCFYTLVAVLLNTILYLFAAVVLFNIDLSTVLR
jgi:hypothetical protein